LNAASANRFRYGDAPKETAVDIKTVSDVIRKATENGLDVLEGDRDRLRDLFLDIYTEELKVVLAYAREACEKGTRAQFLV